MSVLASAQKQDIPAFQANDDTCPQCKSERYLNKSMKLLVGPCYHKMCETCVLQRFDAGPAPCPVCQRILRKAEFYQQIFEDLTVENEVRIRKRMAMIYNKRQEDFKTLKDYNDYLEMVEELTLKLLDDTETDETDYVIEKYRRDNAASIEKNQSKFQREEKLQRMISEQEQLQRQKMRSEYRKQLEDEQREKNEAKDSVINALANSDRDANDIVQKSKMIRLKKSSLSNKKQQHKANLNIEALLNAVGADDGDFMEDDDEEEEEDSGPFDPFDSPYQPFHVELRDKYDDPNPAFRQGNNLAAAGVSREMHQRYVIEGAMAGLFVKPLDASDKDSRQI